MSKEKLPVRLLKQKKVKDGKTYNNLYIQFGDGQPIAVELVHWNPKIKNLCLANAYDFEIYRNLKVASDGTVEVNEDGKSKK